MIVETRRATLLRPFWPHRWITVVAACSLTLAGCSSADSGESGAPTAKDASLPPEGGMPEAASRDAAPRYDAMGDASPMDVLDIADQLKAIPGMTVTEQELTIEGARVFALTLDQPSNHDQPSGPHFQQRLTLVHRSKTAPMVITTSGYGLDEEVWEEEPTLVLGSNQISFEHRYFSPSRPAMPEWKDVTIRQAAADQHHIIDVFRPIYGGRWISTGISKGGETVLFHRRFYPSDVDGTVSYSGPLVHGLEDKRFTEFLRKVGPETCRTRLDAFQREALQRRTELVALLKTSAPTTVTISAASVKMPPSNPRSSTRHSRSGKTMMQPLAIRFRHQRARAGLFRFHRHIEQFGFYSNDTLQPSRPTSTRPSASSARRR